MSLRAVVGAAALALVVTSCGSAASDVDAAPVHADAGAGLTAEAAAAQVLAGLGGTTVRSVEVIDVPPGSGTKSRAPWVSTTLDSDLGDDVSTNWLGNLAQGAVRDLMRRSGEGGAGVIGGGQIVLRDTDGTPLTVPLGHGSGSGGRKFASPSDDELRARVSEAADRFGLDVQSVQVLHPLASAVSAVFVVPDGEVSWSIDQLCDAIEGDPGSIEGYDVQLVSPAGQLLLRTAAAHRIPAGSLSFAEGQDVRFKSLHGGPPATHG